MTEEESSKFTTKRRSIGSDGELKWGGEDGEQWSEAVESSQGITVQDDGTISTGSEIPDREVYLTGRWESGEEPTTADNLVDDDPTTGVTDGEVHDNNHADGSLSAQIRVEYESPFDCEEISYDVQISHNGNSWNSFRHDFRVSDGGEWETIDSWGGSSGGSVAAENTVSAPFDIEHVELDLTVNGGAYSGEWISAYIDFYNYELIV